jgi:hypothetical protein
MDGGAQIPLGPFKSFVERISLKGLDREEEEAAAAAEEVAKYMSSCTKSTVLRNKKQKTNIKRKARLCIRIKHLDA